MSWAKADKNKNDIRQVDEICEKSFISMKKDVEDFISDATFAGKVFPSAELKRGTLADMERKNLEMSKVIEKKFIDRAKKCAELKTDLKIVCNSMENKFSKAATWAERQGLNFNNFS